MPERKLEKCAHPGCNCPAAKNSKYCGTYCEGSAERPSIACNTAFQGPMTDVFDIHSSGNWSFVAKAPTVLTSSQLATVSGGSGVQFAAGPRVKPKHSAGYWAKATAGFDFSDADRVPPAKFNKVLWKGLMRGKP